MAHIPASTMRVRGVPSRPSSGLGEWSGRGPCHKRVYEAPIPFAPWALFPDYHANVHYFRTVGICKFSAAFSVGEVVRPTSPCLGGLSPSGPFDSLVPLGLGLGAAWRHSSIANQACPPAQPAQPAQPAKRFPVPSGVGSTSAFPELAFRLVLHRYFLPTRPAWTTILAWTGTTCLVLGFAATPHLANAASRC
jgi:hypothetical protein